MTDQAPLNCSCPKCHTDIQVLMRHNTDENHVMDSVQEMMGDDLKLVGSYTFIGESKCTCGNLIIACLTISAQAI